MSVHTYAASGVGKEFLGISVLRDVDFVLTPGYVHALLGENGSGKTTLIKILGGGYMPGSGGIMVDGEAVALSGPAHAQRLGLAIVHQDYQLFPDLDIAANIGIGSGLPYHRYLRLFDRRQMHRRAEQVLARVGLHIDPSVRVRTLGLVEWKLVEIARALLADASFLILDEPTALLDRRDSARILAIIEQLRELGMGIAFVSHRLDEALRVADHFTVLRDGNLVASLDKEEVDAQTLVYHVVGPKGHAADRIEEPPRELGEPVLELQGAQALPGAPRFDLMLQSREILGLTGLVGSGALETARMVGGRRTLTGSLRVEGRTCHFSSPAQAIRVGIGYVPEERTALGLVPQLSVEVNILLASLPDVSPGGILRRSSLRRRARTYVDRLAIRAPSLRAPVRTLSGGNQQKVQIAKWLASKQRILVVESPTHGVDIGAKAEIHRLLREFAAGGGAVLVASTDIPEVLALADRVAVFNNGELVRVFEAAEKAHGEVLLSGTHDSQVDEIERLLER